MSITKPWVAEIPMRCNGPPGQGLQPLQGQGQIGAALVAGQGMNLVEDDRPRRPQQLASRGRGQQNVEGFGGSHQDMGRQTTHPLALGLGSIAGARPGAGCYRRQAQRRQLVRGARQRPLQIELDIGGRLGETGAPPSWR